MSRALTPYTEIIDLIGNLPLILRETRRARGMSQRAVARTIGMSFSTICRIENGEDANVSNVVAILRWMATT